MVIPEKIYSSNPFVDNVIYYGKLMAMNCTIKDEEEALANETKESLYAGDVFIACVENRATYEMFESIPKEILEKYISSSSNLDIYAENPKNLKTKLNSYSAFARNKILNNLSSLARTVYIDHFDVMADYLKKVGPNWLIDNAQLYAKCKNGTATYKDLFDALPIKTVMRIIKRYLNSHGYCDLVSIWDPDQITADVLSSLAAEEAILNGNMSPNKTIVLDTDYLLNTDEYDASVSDYMNQFELYIRSRSDLTIRDELNKISKAMREVFISHYDIMKQRQYFSTDLYYKNISEYAEELGFYTINDDRFMAILENGEVYRNLTTDGDTYVYSQTEGEDIDLSIVDPAWMTFYYDRATYQNCKSGKATYYELYNLFPSGERLKVLAEVLGQDAIDYNLNDGDVEVLRAYFESYAQNSTAKRVLLNKRMREVYIDNYQLYLNNDIYLKCKNNQLDFYDLYEYLPPETIKSIINTEIEETTNLQAYSDSKSMLNSYLNTLDPNTAQEIKDAITIDMIQWYPSHHIEKNNYYRALIGLPPIDSNGNVYEDTLLHSYDATSGSFLEFGNRFISQVPTSIYPEYHWKNELYNFDSYDIATLNEYGIIDDWVTTGCASTKYSSRYRYLRYLGDEKLDLYTCRKAENFSIIGMPSIDNSDIYKKFIDAFSVNREYVIRAVYSDAYKFNSDYYNKFIIIFILVNTIMDILAGIPDLIINRDVFDARCIKYLFESYGVPYYSEIPIKYQQAMLKNLNTLIKYKSSTKNMIDICKLFGFNDIKVFGYYLMKDREVDSYTGEYILDENNDIHYDLSKIYVLDETGDFVDISGRRFSKLLEYRYYDEDYYLKTITVMQDDGTTVSKKIINNDRDLYIFDAELNQMIPLKATDYFTKVKANTTPATLKFVRVPINEPITKYKNDSDYLISYDEITAEDTWDGGLDHDYLAKKILDYEFNAVKSKYISIETVTNLTEMAFQVSYFYSMLFDNLYSEESLTLQIPTLSQNHRFKLTDIIFYLFALAYYYNDIKDTIMYSPTQILYVKGYNFNEALNAVLDDERYFTQTDSAGNPLDDADKENIFNVNERIDKDNYDYQEEFDTPEYYVKGFNLQANIDSLDRWLNENWQMSLEDFVVSTDTDTYGQILTLKQFYSLNNSYYQKNIFNGLMIPAQFNNIIKYAFGFDLLEKIYSNDISNTAHAYIKEIMVNDSSDDLYDFILDIVALVSKSNSSYTYDELLDRLKSVNTLSQLENYAYILTNIFGVDDESMLVSINDDIEHPYYNEIINSTADTIYVLDNKVYAIRNNEPPIAVYHKYTRNDNGDFILDTKQYYIPGGNDYIPLINGNIYIKNADGLFTFSATKVYALKNEEYVEITDENFITLDPDTGEKILNFGNYYIKQDDKLILNPDNCYIRVIVNGEERFMLLKDIDEYAYIVTDSDCYIRHDDGHFVRFDYTDYYRRTHYDDEHGNEMVYHEEELYIVTDSETEYFDPSVEPRVYYKKLSDYYTDNDYASYKDILYVKDSYGNFIPEENIVSPTNCWYFDYESQEYKLVKNNQYRYNNYESPKNVLYIMVLQENYDYYKYALDGNGNYKLVQIPDKRYVVNSDTRYITMLNETDTYSNTNRLIVIFNKAVTDGIIENTMNDDSYNPSLNDGVWDENDWYYTDDSWDDDNAIRMNGENIWYYRNHNQNIQSQTTNTDDIIGSGFIIDADEYIKDIDLVSGETYYMSFDLEANFNGAIQVYNQADPSVTNSTIRVYPVRANEAIHINQTFKANNNANPSIMLIKYNFNTNPIRIGDYCVVSNIKFSKSYSDKFIADDIPSYDQLLMIYKTNEAIYKYLVTQMQQTSDKKTYDIYKKLYDSLMITKYNKEIFKLKDGTYATTYTDFLQSRDEILYDKLAYYRTLDLEAMRKEIANEIIEIIYGVDEVLNNAGNLDYLYAYFPAVSTSFIQQYIYKLINWFKSWKVHLLGINTLYRMGNGVITDANGNVIAEYSGDTFNIKILHDELPKIKLGENQKDGFVYGEVKINPLDATNPAGIPYSDLFDLSDSVTRFGHDAGIRHRVRIMTRQGNTITYTGDDNEIMHIHINDDSTKVSVENGNKLVIHSDDTFSVRDDNRMILTNDEDPQAVYDSQIIDEINLLSGDFIEYDSMEDDDYE